LTKLTAIQLKVLIHETLQAQIEFVKFLRMAAQRYERLLSEEEGHEGAILMQRATETIDRLTDIIDNATITLPNTRRDESEQNHWA
jgi:hypothetical protein